MTNESSQLEVQLQIAFLKEDNSIIAYSPALDLSAYGDNEREAKKAFEVTLQLFLEEMTERGTLLNELLRLGWELKRSEYKPPSINRKLLQERLSSHILKGNKEPEIIRTAMQEVSIPT